MSRPEDFLNMLYEPDQWTDGQWSSDPPNGISFPFLPSNLNADTKGGLTSPTPAGRQGYMGTDSNSLYHGHQNHAQPPLVTYGYSNHSYPTNTHQDRAPGFHQAQLPNRGVYGSDDTYGMKPQDQAPRCYKSELPTPAPSDHNYGVETQAAQPDGTSPPTKSAPSGADEDYDIDSQWMSEIDPKVLDPTNSNCTSQL